MNALKQSEVMNPLDALFTLSEVAIALAGFIAIASVLRSVSGSSIAGARIRVINLLSVSFGLLLVCQLSIALNYAEVNGPTTWRISSLLWILITIPTTVYNLRNQAALSASGMDNPRFASWLLYPSIAAVVILQIVNIAILGAFWPFFVATILVLAIGGLSFSILVLQFLRPSTEDSDDA